LFERFLNESRSDMPDVDLDFDSVRRDEVIAYVMEKYAGQAAMVATIPTFRARGAIRKLGRAFGYSYDKIDRLTTFLPYYLKGSQIEEASHALPELKDTPLKDETELLRMAAKISGLPYQLSVHLGGVVIAPEELASWVPVEMSNKGFPVAQYDKDDVEALGLVKLDLLGLRMHTAIQRTLDLLAEQGIFLDLDNISIDDEKTFRLLRTTETVGVFQVESPGQRQLLGRLQPKKFSDIIAEISLFRPGPMKGDMVTPYVERRNGKEPVRYPHPDLEPILKETYGVVLFQEQVLKIANCIAGFSFAEADQLRRAMTKNRSAEEMERIKAYFIQGAIRQGYSQKTAEKIFAMVASFAGYGFCKAHAASFAHITYQSAFLKAHYPLEFYLGLLNAGHVGSYPKSVILNEAKRMGFEVLGPHINYSHQDYTTENGGIRIGLLALNGLGPRFCERILKERKQRPFASIKEFCRRVKLPQEIVLRLSLAGAFLGVPISLNLSPRYGRSSLRGRQSAQSPGVFEVNP